MKDIISLKSVTFSVVVRYILFGLLFTIIGGLLTVLMLPLISNFYVYFILLLIISVLVSYFSWIVSAKSKFKDYDIEECNSKLLIRNLLIIIILFTIITLVMNYYNINDEIALYKEYGFITDDLATSLKTMHIVSFVINIVANILILKFPVNKIVQSNIAKY